MTVSIPTDTGGFVQFINGANAFYIGSPRPSGSWFANGPDERGWDFAARMAQIGARAEARHATTH